jgi:GNAT superfamily N-acetyltransferase
VERSLAFFRGLPEEDREYLRNDVTRRSVVVKRVKMIESGLVERLVAVADDRIVADGALELAGEDWMAHMAKMRLIVGHEHQRIGLGTLLSREIYLLAASLGVEQLVVTIARPQVGAQRIVRKLGFREEATLPDYVRGRGGSKQDLIFMRCDLEAMWRKLETIFAEADRQQLG